jgi:hypothetical protein
MLESLKGSKNPSFGKRSSDWKIPKELTPYVYDEEGIIGSTS